MVCDNLQDLDLKHMMEENHYLSTNMLGMLQANISGKDKRSIDNCVIFC